MKMQRFTPYLGIVAGLILGVLFGILSGGTSVVVPDASLNLSTFTPLSEPDLTASTSTEQVGPSQTVGTVIQKKVAAPKPVSAAPAPAPNVSSPAAATVSLDISASALRAALVNIICYAPAGSGLRSTSGSGVIVDPKGIILTNAHIAQHFLLKGRGVSCTIRSGNPATDRYSAALAYISPLWLRANPEVLTKTAPSGNGQYDFAFLAISRSATSDPLPALFPFVPLATVPPLSGAPVVIASYGAQFLTPGQVASGLSPTIVSGSIKDVLTFGANTIDVLALGGSAAAQEGSSGGGVVDMSGALVGTITTSTITGTTDTRSLNAITASYIRGEYASETGNPLDFLLAKPVADAIAEFAPKMTELESIITAFLP